MKIQILGSGCTKCKALEANTVEAAEKLGIDAEVEKVTDIDTILDMGVMMTPGLVVNGEVKSSGNLLSVEQISEILAG